jgi:hypothetical protein
MKQINSIHVIIRKARVCYAKVNVAYCDKKQFSFRPVFESKISFNDLEQV